MLRTQSNIRFVEDILSSEIKHRRCPHCGGQASTGPGENHLHGATHVISDGIKHRNPLMVGAGLVAAGMHVVKKLRYTCSNCEKKFFLF